MNHGGAGDSDEVKEPGFHPHHLTAELHSTVHYSQLVVSTSEAASKITPCKSSQYCLSLSEVQMRR